MTAEITLRHLRQDDYTDIQKYICNPEVAKYLTWQVYTQEKDITDYFNKALTKITYPDEILGIEHQSKIIGTVHLILRRNKFIQVGFGITPNLWNRGIGTKTLRVILDYIQNTKWSKMAKEIWADVHKSNIYAVKIFKKQGFILQKTGPEPNRKRLILKII